MIEIHELDISDRVIDKLARKHRVTVVECNQAFVEDPERMAVWATDNTRNYGRRLKVVGQTWGGRTLLGYLYPTEDPIVWRLATAREV